LRGSAGAAGGVGGEVVWRGFAVRERRHGGGIDSWEPATSGQVATK
jgi:hypothetical protein